MEKLPKKQIATIKDAAKKLTCAKRRAFQAQVTIDYLNGSARKAERIFGWRRTTVELGLNELRTGIICVDSFSSRGNHNSEEKLPHTRQDICSLAEPESQVDPKFQSKFTYTRITSKAMRQALIDEKGWLDEQLPCENTIGNIMNRLGYRLLWFQKAKPLKKVRQTDAIFANVQKENQASDEREDSLRISIDTFATVNIGNFSRGGQSRGKEAVKADDHDMHADEKVVPFGILVVLTGMLTIIFGTSKETSDFIVDCLQQWWDDNKDRYAHINQLVINLDNGPHNSSARTQFMKRMVEFAEHNDLEIVLVYYPPYHSKYNPIERCWGILEQHWNGALLDSVETILQWACTMTWKGIHPVVTLLDDTYENGVRIAKKAFKKIEECFKRDKSLPKYCIRIQPLTA